MRPIENVREISALTYGFIASRPRPLVGQAHRPRLGPDPSGRRWRSGAYTLSLLKQYPQLRATILDFPETVSTAKTYALQTGMNDRIRYLRGNAITTEWRKVRMSC